MVKRIDSMIRVASAMLIIYFAASLHAEEPKRIAHDEAMSSVILKIRPDYPRMAKQLKISGNVELKATIEEDGTVNEVSTVSGNPLLTKAAVDAVKRWKFKPFTTDGKPGRVVTVLTVAFNPIE